MRKIMMHHFGDADVLVEESFPDPHPAPGEVLVRVAGAGVNPVDWKTRQGKGFVAEAIADRLPWTPGFELSGMVEAVGDGVTRWAPGDRVFGLVGFNQRGGAYSSLAPVPESELVALPEDVDLFAAGAVPLAALTAWQALFDVAQLESGDKVLIHAAAGGVGHFAVQFAALRDIHVIGTCSGDHVDFVSELGASEVIDYTEDNFLDECYGLDAVIDLVGGQVGVDSLHALSEKGRLVTVPTNTAESVIAEARKRGLQASGMVMRADNKQLETIAELLAAGDVRVHIEKEYALAGAGMAHDHLEQGHVAGKLLLLADD